MLGNLFTWTSKVQGSSLLCRLNKVMVNGEWMVSYPQTMGRVFPWGISNHIPLLLSSGDGSSHRRLAFRFFNHWTESDEFVAVVSSVWVQHQRDCPWLVWCKI